MKKISIIICARSNDIPREFRDNIQKTIGISHELIIIDNSLNQYSIFEAYNKGGSIAKGDILCFCHDDILFHTENWGQKVINHFSDNEIGMIGVAGGNLSPIAPAPWWNVPGINDHLIYLIQHWTTKQPTQNYYTKIDEIRSKADKRPNANVTQPAVLIDGLWFCIKSSLFKNKVKFDEETFKGFHCYDADISLQVFQYKKNVIIYDVLIEHFSDASINRRYFEEYLKLSTKWMNKAPFYAKPLNSKRSKSEYEAKALLEFAYYMQASKMYTDNEIRKEIKKLLFNLPYHIKVYEWYQLFFWSCLGYSFARYPNAILRKILK